MLVLSLDTSTRAGSCALLRDDRVLREEASDMSRDQAERLPAELAAILARESVLLAEVDAFAVATGPGSFTGLRVGIATMQGLAMAVGKPLIGVSAFDALYACAASPAGSPGEPDKARPTRIATWIGAWRGEVFAALYENGRVVDAPTVARPVDLIAGVAADPDGRPAVFTGDGAAIYQDVIRDALGDTARLTDPVSPLLAGALAMLAGRAYLDGERPLPHAIRPIYVRRPGAPPVQAGI